MDGIAGRLTGAVGDDTASISGADLARPRGPALEDVVEHAGAAGLGKKLRPKTDQRTGGNDIVEPNPPGAMVRHVLHRGLPGTEELGHGADVLLRDIDGEPFGRLVERAVDLLSQHLGLADRELEALTPHRLDENSQL